MKLFNCGRCGAVLFFENGRCGQCGSMLGYVPEAEALTALAPVGDEQTADAWNAVDPSVAGGTFRLCRNAIDHQACNWLVPAGDGESFCRSCRLNEIVPDLSDPAANEGWRRLESAKRRLLYSLFALGLPLEEGASSPDGPGGLRFRFLRDTPEEKVTTGHADGVITLNASEADAAFREHTREQLGEDYRTLLGHFRHESGHYYWDRLLQGSDWIGRFRELFGDETASYQEAREEWPPHQLPSYARLFFWGVCCAAGARNH